MKASSIARLFGFLALLAICTLHLWKRPGTIHDAMPPQQVSSMVNGMRNSVDDVKSESGPHQLPTPTRELRVATNPQLVTKPPQRRSLKYNFERIPVFSDFDSYKYPNRSVLLAEVPTTRPRSSSDLPQPSGDEVLDQFPCVNASVTTEKVLPGEVKLFVPWKSIPFMSPDPLICPIKCTLTNNKADIPDVDGYVVDTLGAMVNEPYNWLENRYNLKLIAFNTENIRGRLKVLKKAYGIRYLAKPYNETFWDSFNIVISYESGSMLQIPFYHWANCREPIVKNQVMRAREVQLWPKEKRLILFFSRNCDHASQRRQAFVRKIMEHTSVDAVGRCLNNRAQDSFKQCNKIKDKNKRLCIIASYHFYLSIENSVSMDYVSEKVYEPLLVGTIPIYLGAPNIKKFLPAPHSAIVATDFPSVKKMIQYVTCVSKSPKLLEYYHNWRSRMYPRFKEEVLQQYPPLCKACMMINMNSSRLYDPSIRRPSVVAEFIDDDEENDQRPLKECL